MAVAVAVIVMVVTAVIAAFLARRAVAFIIEGLLVLLFLIELEGLNEIPLRVSIIILLNRIIILPFLILGAIIKI